MNPSEGGANSVETQSGAMSSFSRAISQNAPASARLEGPVVKVGVVTDDGRTISPHFGRAPYYLVYEIQDGFVKAKEQRPKPGHQPNEMHHHSESGHHGAGEELLHDNMLSGVRDCQALIARGMGMGMYMSIEKLGIKPFLTEKVDADEAVQAYIRGNLDNQPGKLH